MSSKIEPCPFCGQRDALVEQLDSDASVVICQGLVGEHSACLARGPVGVQDEDIEDQPGRDAAIREWNHRAAPVVERQPSLWVHPSYLVRREGMRPMAIDATLDQIASLQIPLYTTPPELAELQATIERLTEQLAAQKLNLELSTNSAVVLAETADEEVVALKTEIERLKGGQGEPVALTVWEGDMPESNGKSNFTVILHTGDLTEGICVYRSEYPDRARYEADCFRHLIGDPAFPEKPFICDYDADKHSGYVKPDTSQLAPVSVEAAKAFAKGFNTLETLDGKYKIVMQFAGHDDAWAAYTELSQMTDRLDKVKEPN